MVAHVLSIKRLILSSVDVHRIQLVFGKCEISRDVFQYDQVIGRCETSQLICTNTICSNNGICYVDASSGNTTLRCICIQGYTGQYCQSVISSINPCLLNPCGNTGICFPSSNASYYCLCPNGLIAQSCNTSSSWHNKEKKTITSYSLDI